MPNLKPFPSKEAELNSYLLLAVGYVELNKIRLQVSPENIELLESRLSDWNTWFPLSQDTAARTKNIVANKDVAKEKIISTLRSVYKDIPASILTPSDRNTLNLYERSTTRTPSPVPSTFPVVIIDTSFRQEHIISFTDQDGSAAKPFGVHGCQIWYSIGAYPTDERLLTYMFTDTASPHTHKFSGDDAGKTVYYLLRWENTRGETGPWSGVASGTITGY